MVKLSDFVAARLKERYGVKSFFMVSGGGSIHLNISLGAKLRYICSHNEQAAGIAGEGYARFKGELAVVNVTTGPGGINALSGLFGAWTDSQPVLFISGQIKYSTTLESCKGIPLRQLGDQEADIISVVKGLTKYAVMVTEAYEIKYHLDRAVWEALNGRLGPVWLDIPLNIQATLIDEEKLKEFTPPLKTVYDLKIAEVIERLKKAERPLIVAGHGIRLAGALGAFDDLARKLEFPVVATFNSFDIVPESHKLYIGRIGTIGTRAGNFALQNADTVLFLGTRNNIRQVSYNYENFAKNAFKIAVDIDEGELAKPLVKPDLAVHADLAEFLRELLNTLGDERHERPDWLLWCRKRRERYGFDNTPEYRHRGKLINPYIFTRKLFLRLEEGSVVVLANATAVICAFQTAVIKSGQRVFSNSGSASMGYDLPASIGASIAAGFKKTVCVAGDGSIMMNIQELAVIKHYKLPVKIFLLNNGGYSSVKQTHDNFFGVRVGVDEKTGVSFPDFLKVGEAFGIRAMRIESPGEIERGIEEALTGDDAVLCEVMIDPDSIFTPKLSSKMLADGTMVSSSLEDMYPFLSEEELRENTIG